MTSEQREHIASVIARDQVDESIVRGVLARVPPSWELLRTDLDSGSFRRGNINVIVSVSRESDGQIWVHVSACGRREAGIHSAITSVGVNSYFLPSWDDMKRVKHDFIGPDRWAYQVFPSEAQYIDQHPCVLHLFARLEGESALPDFTKGTGSI